MSFGQSVLRICIYQNIDVVNLFYVRRGNNFRGISYSINFSAVKQNYLVGVLRGQIDIVSDKNNCELLRRV